MRADMSEDPSYSYLASALNAGSSLVSAMFTRRYHDKGYAMLGPTQCASTKLSSPSASNQSNSRGANSQPA